MQLMTTSDSELARCRSLDHSLALFGITFGESASRGGYKLSLAQPDLKTAGSRDERERKKKGSTCRIGYHELSRRTVASEGCQPVDLVRNPHRVESKPGLAKRFHERFTQPDPDPNSVSFPCRFRFSRRRRDCL